MVNFADIVPPFLKEFGYSADICSSENEAKEKAAQGIGRKRTLSIFSAVKLQAKNCTKNFLLKTKNWICKGIIALGVILIYEDATKMNSMKSSGILRLFLVMMPQKQMLFPCWPGCCPVFSILKQV